MKVILGSHTAKAFVVAPKDFDVIGIVQIGMEFGLLGRSKTGDYYRVNGSQSQLLNRQEVEDAIYSAKHFGRGESFSASRRTKSNSNPHRVPVVLVKKNRRFNCEIPANSNWQPLAA